MKLLASLLAMLMALAAMPAQAQETGLPTWLVGTWCGALGGGEKTGSAAPQLCDSWSVGPNGTLENRIERTDEPDDAGSSGRIAIEDGRLVLRGGEGGATKVDYRELSRGPQSVTFENQLPGIVERLSLQREGNVLIEVIWVRGRETPQRSEYYLQSD